MTFNWTLVRLTPYLVSRNLIHKATGYNPIPIGCLNQNLVENFMVMQIDFLNQIIGG
jgi:hypothetical protein